MHGLTPPHFGYDTPNRLLAQHTFPDSTPDDATDDDASTIQRTYDRAGHLVRTTTPTGRELYQTFDALGRLVSRVHDDHVFSFSYDSNSNLVREVHSAGGQKWETACTYNARNALESVTYEFPGLAEPRTVSYTYTPDGRRDTLTTPTGRIVRDAYGPGSGVATEPAYGLVTGIAWEGQPASAVAFAYGESGHLNTRASGNGALREYRYEAAARVAITRDSLTATGDTVLQLETNYDDDGRRTFEKRVFATGANLVQEKADRGRTRR